jgi:hypothetical protein
MDLASIDTIWLIVALVFLNFFLVAVVRTRDRFWHPPIILWLALFFALILLHVGYSHSIERQEAAVEYQTFPDRDNGALLQMQLQQAKMEERVYKAKTFRLLGTQVSSPCFFWASATTTPAC